MIENKHPDCSILQSGCFSFSLKAYHLLLTNSKVYNKSDYLFMEVLKWH